jgi:hypothetical protein
MRGCHFIYFIYNSNFFKVIENTEQTLSAESFFKTLIDPSLDFFQKLCVTFSFECFHTLCIGCSFKFPVKVGVEESIVMITSQLFNVTSLFALFVFLLCRRVVRSQSTL